MRTFIKLTLACFFLASFQTPAQAMDTDAVLNQYAALAYKDYEQAYKKALDLQKSVRAFVEAPSDKTLNKAKTSWLAAREPYGRTEVFRFYEGPIDFYDAEKNQEGPEARLNAWPLNEAYIDYVQGNPGAGIVQDPSIPLNRETLLQKNQDGDEANVATGYHAIEFLLWGQDLSADGPGNRPVSDYMAENKASQHRGAYLLATTDLLVDDLKFLVDQWVPGQDNYAKEFIAGGAASLAKILTGAATLSGFELASERMATALDSGDQEDEHSCFSDNTHNDFIYNAEGIFNAYFEGGVYEYLKERNEDLAEELEEQLLATRKLMKNLPHPIDREILSAPANSPPRTQMEEAVASLQKQADLFKEAGKALGVDVQIVQ